MCLSWLVAASSVSRYSAAVNLERTIALRGALGAAVAAPAGGSRSPMNGTGTTVLQRSHTTASVPSARSFAMRPASVHSPARRAQASCPHTGQRARC